MCKCDETKEVKQFFGASRHEPTDRPTKRPNNQTNHSPNENENEIHTKRYLYLPLAIHLQPSFWKCGCDCECELLSKTKPTQKKTTNGIRFFLF